MGAHGDRRALFELRAPAARGKAHTRRVPCHSKSKKPHPRRRAGGAFEAKDSRLGATSHVKAPSCEDVRGQLRGKRARARLSKNCAHWIVFALHAKEPTCRERD